ncbi:MAG: 50S ribosomal protein L30 [Chitinophagales bacterium]|nr:MAG: 50S ribosomal protein L30 [Chitinophagales bacterium]
MTTLKITLVRSAIKKPERQKATLRALGLKKLNSSVELEHTPQIEGMLRKVSHLVKVEKV